MYSAVDADAYLYLLKLPVDIVTEVPGSSTLQYISEETVSVSFRVSVCAATLRFCTL